MSKLRAELRGRGLGTEDVVRELRALADDLESGRSTLDRFEVATYPVFHFWSIFVRPGMVRKDQEI